MAHAGHSKTVCLCGKVVRQCRCAEPGKTVYRTKTCNHWPAPTGLLVEGPN